MSNVGNLDRLIRVILGLALVLVPLIGGWALWSGVVAVIGAVLVVTAIVGFCPIYALFGLSSKRRQAQ
jgi:hypothetical protein